jgi:hypothetical protein
LRETDLLGKAVVGQLEQLLQLRFDLNDTQRKQRALELHAADRFGEALLLRRETLDGVAERFRRGHLLQQQRNFQIIFVLNDHAVLGLEDL